MPIGTHTRTLTNTHIEKATCPYPFQNASVHRSSFTFRLHSAPPRPCTTRHLAGQTQTMVRSRELIRGTPIQDYILKCHEDLGE
ncbi:hypothetical protein PoB_004456000 [Plakobranchus ocellatus]|uniref:Uncharacterized protein n=1 Tax=Plakobranchus ocellatus TaxID=259542 RepID=A0AAV4BBR6_9GAST|nr:hypothetical protein PoB_004456000 [Plakobranchus ocellatus]